MKCYTWCNIINHYKLEVLEKSAKAFNIEPIILGKGIIWEHNFQKIGLLLDAIVGLKEDELILCTAYDVLFLQDTQIIIDKYISMCKTHNMHSKIYGMHGIHNSVNNASEPFVCSSNSLANDCANNCTDIIHTAITSSVTKNPIIFSAERLYRHHNPRYKSYWDAMPNPFEYKYLNGDTFIGYQKNLVIMLKQILEDVYSTDLNSLEKNDQKLYAEYAIKNPDKIILDRKCELFWCPTGEQEILQDLYKIEYIGPARSYIIKGINQGNEIEKEKEKQIAKEIQKNKIIQNDKE